VVPKPGDALFNARNLDQVCSHSQYHAASPVDLATVT
jgi:hypothetical protein